MQRMLQTWKRGGRGAKLVARLLFTAAICVRIQTFLKNHVWATLAKQWSAHSIARQKNLKRTIHDLLSFEWDPTEIDHLPCPSFFLSSHSVSGSGFAYIS